jgi:hypothetical protein
MEDASADSATTSDWLPSAQTGFALQEVGASHDPTGVPVIHDREREEELHTGLPHGHVFEGGRRSD